MDIQKTIKDFFRETEEDKNHRYKSWEHCYNYFSLENKKFNENAACLHLAFYLASWGMYRGSSFLLQKDYLIHKQAVKLIIKRRDDLRDINFTKITEEKVKGIIDFVKEIKKQYTDNIKKIDGKEDKVNVSDTLASKILLGTLGCVPAYDEYFKNGLKSYFDNNYKGKLTLNKKSLLALIKFYQDNKIDFEESQKNIKEKVGIKYPTMKLIDMYFWNKGFKK